VHFSTFDWRRALSASVALLILSAVILFAMGRIPICACGFVKVWHGVVQSSENSQHLTDWYTFSHVLHGFVFYAFLWWAAPQWTLTQRFIAAVALEAGWEIVENSPMIINRYRTATAAFDYYGDSIINSIADIIAMMAGFFAASRLPVAASIGFFLGIEGAMLWAIRDNLTLNVIMLVWPIEAIKTWQGG
jgi:hypothetical protein